MRTFYKRFHSPETADRRLNAGTGRNWFRCRHPGCAKEGYTYSDRGTGQHWHRGIDIGGEPGRTPLLAGRAGRVVEIGNVDGSAFGKQVLILYRRWWGKPFRGKKLYGFFAHLDEIAVKLGQKVQPWTVIGPMGTTGNASGEHCHKELRLSRSWASAVDEFTWVEQARRDELRREANRRAHRRKKRSGRKPV